MVVGSRDANDVVLVADELLMRQQTDMNLYVITEYQLIGKILVHAKDPRILGS